jgi:hypothetical protein
MRPKPNEIDIANSANNGGDRGNLIEYSDKNRKFHYLNH